MKYFDSHAHYYDERFDDLPGGAGPLLEELFSSSVCGIVNVGTSPHTCRLAVSQARHFPLMYTALGVHPTDAAELARLSESLSEVEALIQAPESKCVALGEIGLDYHYPDTDKTRQMAYFHEQLDMAKRLSLPVVIHDRDAHGDMLQVLRDHPGVRGILHSFSGSTEMAKELIRMDYYISFSGTLTFKNARKTVECAAALPRDRVLIETDAPYLAPHPLRGSINHSGLLAYTCAALASLWQVDAQTCAHMTHENAKRIFGL